MTWAMIGAAAVTTIGSVVGQATAKKPGGPAPQAQLEQDQKAPPLQATALQFQQPQTGQPAMDPKMLQQIVMPQIPQNDPLGDYLKHRQGY